MTNYCDCILDARGKIAAGNQENGCWLNMIRLAVALFLYLTLSSPGTVCASPQEPIPSQTGKSTVNDISEHIKQLAGARNFADSVKGENGAFHESYALYRKVFDEALGTDVKQLEWLRANGSPAGKVYGAVLLYESSKLGLEGAFKPLLGDHSELVYFSGCKGAHTSVQAMAEKFIADRRYLNFSLSIQCKHLEKQ